LLQADLLFVSPLLWLLVSQRPIPPVEGSCAVQATSTRDDDAPWKVPISFITAESVHASWMLLNGCTAPIKLQTLKVFVLWLEIVPFIDLFAVPVRNFSPFRRKKKPCSIKQATTIYIPDSPALARDIF
jgi:hypothetical protein